MKNLSRSIGAVLIGALIPVMGLWFGSIFNIWDMDFPIAFSWIPFVMGLGLISYMAIDGKSKTNIIKSAKWCVSIAIGMLLLYPLGIFFNKMKWPIFNYWALAHGTFIVAIPILVFVVFKFIGIVEHLFAKNRSTW